MIETIRRFFAWFVVVALLILPAQAGAAGEETIVLLSGDTRLVKLEFDVVKVGNGNPKVCAVQPSGPKQVMIMAREPGVTSVELMGDGPEMHKSLRVEVRPQELNAHAEDLKKILGGVEGITIRPLHNRLLVEGEMLTVSDFNEVQNVLQNYPVAINKVTLSPRLFELLIREIKESVNLPRVSVRAVQKQVVLEGVVSTEVDRAKAENIAKTYGLPVINSINVVVPGPAQPQRPAGHMIQMDLTILAVDRSALKDLSLEWQKQNKDTSGNFELSLEGISGAISGTIDNLFGKAQTLLEHGKGRSLYQQSVITRNGEKASFHMGDQVPVSSSGQNGTSSVQYVEVGLTLEAEPLLDSKKNVEVKVKVESSAVTGEGMGGAPKISKTTLQTAAYLRPGQAIVLGGLMGQRESRGYLGDVVEGSDSPASNRMSMSNAETLVFLRPTILSQPGDAMRGMADKIEGDFKSHDQQR